MTRKWYLAGSMEHQDKVRGLVETFEQALGPGWEIHADWVREEPKDDPDKDLEHWARKDHAQIRECELMIWIGGDPESSGKHAELGIAIERGIPVIAVNPPWTRARYRERCVFLALCEPLMAVDEAVRRLRAWRTQGDGDER